MSKFEWPAKGQEQKVELDLTDPAKLRDSVRSLVGEAVAEALAQKMSEGMKSAGVDTVDRRFLRFPEAERAVVKGVEMRDLMDRTPWNEIPGVERSKRRAALDVFFRNVLFHVPVGEQLGEDADRSVIRALSTTDAAGGYLIPPGFIPEVTRDIAKLSQLYQYVRRIPVSNDAGSMPKVGTNADVSWGSENVAFTDNSGNFFTETTYAIKRMNGLVKLSREIANDSNPDIVGVVLSLFQEAIARECDKVIAIGSGSGRPTGLYSASGITNVSVTTLSYDNLVKIKESVDQRYHNNPNFRWHFNQNVKAAVMLIKDEYGLPIFQLASEKQPATILGVPFSIEASFPNSYVGIGDLSYYVWFDRQSLAVESTDVGGEAFEKHQVFIKMHLRADGKPVVPVTSPFARARAITGVTSLT